ncbi:glycosyltransferase [Paraburkholderia sp. 1N]|uniref:Glycosyltransferase n=1 Tax=Paraburkholderia solitsugae TaxID=2675748 RepID=A0ABX2BNW5_9BURK|nr:glycosyltransferase [Paraburkholderia solitsugae]
MRVNVLLVTYNHERFVQQALDSILMQQFDGEIDIIVADDKSTDATVAVISTYQEIDPRVSISYLKGAKNLGITRNYQRGFAACTADYVAVLEGDDYWTDPCKLAKQVRFLESHRECVMCSANYIVFEEGPKQFTPRVPELEGWNYLTSRSLISDNVIGNFSTCLYRLESLRLLPPSLFTIKAYDWAMHITLGQFGLIGFLKEPMSVYRVHPKGSWSILTYQQKLAEQLALLPQYDRATNGTFHAEFNELARHLISAGAISTTTFRTHTFERRLLIKMLKFVVSACPPFIVGLAKLTIPPVLVGRLQNIIRR